jgi:hypothetical protein
VRVDGKSKSQNYLSRNRTWFMATRTDAPGLVSPRALCNSNAASEFVSTHIELP